MTASSAIDADTTAQATAPQSCPPRGSDLHVVHVTSSRFFGGPERQMLELARELAPDVKTSFVSFAEDGLCEDFLGRVRSAGFKGTQLKHDTPHLARATRELRRCVHELSANVLCVHGYKAGLLGLLVGRKLGIPVVAVSRGWTAENWKIRLYERIDRIALRYMDRVVCVSHGQCDKVRHSGVAPARLSVIHNAVRTERFHDNRNVRCRGQLAEFFGDNQPSLIVGAAGRLSPEKGFDVLVDACKLVKEQCSVDVGMILFGDGPLREDLRRQIDTAELGQQFILAGFTSELDRFMPCFDIFVQSSHTEGLPNVLLEAAAAGVPVVATNVGGTREVVVDHETGLIVPADNPQALASGINKLAANVRLREIMGGNASQRIGSQFTFEAQAGAYRDLLAEVVSASSCAVRPDFS